MKYLIVFALLGLLFWKWQAQRNGRLQRKPPMQMPRPEGSIPMQACTLCGLNVPQPESLQGHQGRYCCEAHRQRAEG